MKRFFLAVSALLLGCLAFSATVSANVQNFNFKEFVGDYYLSKDIDGRATLKVVEKFTAQFPEFNQNKGVVRAIPKVYDGHSVSVNIESLLRNGKTEPIYDQYTQNNYLIIETGNDDYVRGDQTYTLTYTLRDVIKDFGTHQEFYWDTIGTQSSQRFGSVTAHVHLDESIASNFTNETACYQGSQRSSQTCNTAKEDNTITFSSIPGTWLPAGHNLTMVVGFEAGTFTPYQMSGQDIFAGFVLPGIAVLLSVIATAWAIITRATKGRDAAGRGTIVPEYLPPNGVSVMLASGIKGRASSVITAQLVDLAVRHKIRIEEKEVKKLFGMSKEYSITLLDSKDLLSDEKRLLEVTTGLKKGGTYTLKKNDTKVGNELAEILQKSSKDDVIERDYRKVVTGTWKPILFAVVASGTAWLTIMMNSTDGIAWPIGLAVIVSVLSVILSMILLLGLQPLTQKGTRLKEYLEGLEIYIKLAEKDRLKALQSPEGADKSPVDTDDKKQMVRLYERVLPYAILFGLEKEWAKVLEVQYSEQNIQPDWYVGGSAFNAALFSASLGNFTSATSSNFSTPSNSSSSGLGGGGFSGGGGGGGGFGGR